MITNSSEFHATRENGLDSSFAYDASTILAVAHHLVELAKALNWSADELIATATSFQIRGVLEIIEVLGKIPPRSK